MWIPRAARFRGTTVFFTLACLAFAPGCGNNEDGAGLAPVDNPQQTLEDNLTSFNAFDSATSNDPGDQLLGDPALGQVLEAIGFGYFEPATSTIREGFSKRQAPWSLVGPEKLRPTRPRVALADAGTYDRDVNDVTEPFPGWVLADQGNPSNGYVFRFQLDDGFSYWDELSMTQVPVQGEFRLLDVVISNPGTPDEYLQHLAVEIAASPTSDPAPTLARLEATVTVTNASVRVVVGNSTANDPTDPGASFVGPLMYYAELALGGTQTVATFASIEQVYHSVDRFGARVESGATVDLQTNETTQANFVFSMGETSAPNSPPLRMSMNLSNFRMVGFNEVALVNGSITFNSAPLATLAGDTSEIPVDVDGDGTNDGTCVNINVTFADDSSVSQNICEAIGSLEDAIFPTAF